MNEKSKDMPTPDKKMVAVLTRAIAVDGMGTDTLTRICTNHDRLRDVVDWAAEKCQGSAAFFIRLEITESDE